MKRTTTIKMAVAAALCLMGASAANAYSTDKINLKGNMQLEYNQLPKPVDTLREAFTEGMIYGRLRANAFYWDWDVETAVPDANNPGYNKGNKDNKNMGLGGSLIYKTAPLHGISGTLGLYTSQNPLFWRVDKRDIATSKSGKDTFSRRDVFTGGHYGMTVLGQAYLQYDFSETSIVAGRQIFESVFTKSNDTKMVPNTFDGVSATIKEIPDTTLQLAYFVGQKLRDHTSAHDVIAFGGGTTNAQKWSENDDSAVNKSLTVALIGNENELMIGSVTNSSVKNLKANVSYAIVPDVLSNLTLEGHYKIPVGKWAIVPGVRYMKQMDDLNVAAGYNGGKGVANLAGDASVGYSDPDSLDGSLWAARIDVKNGPLLARVGYSEISDDADIVAPWRGFPTGGFTRAMAQYNWYANTKTTMLQLDFDFGKADLVDDFKVSARYAMQDFDDDKAKVQADSDIFHVDMIKKLAEGLEGKIRVGMVDADPGNTGKADISYNEYRVELNYFF